jgi:hypothetical protein
MSPLQLSCWSVVLGDACDIAGSTIESRLINRENKLKDTRYQSTGHTLQLI